MNYKADIFLSSLISKEQLRSEGAVLVLSVYDFDKIGKNELMGICVVQCADAPSVSSTSSLLDDGAPKRSNLGLSLFQIEELKPFQELRLRHENYDTEASSFFKLLNKKYSLFSSKR